jgi:LmbE family N-acetylglucosaminyl deacetylase
VTKQTKELEKATNIVFLSPHLDDAVLSCAQIILNLISQGKKVSIVTVFTRSDPGIKSKFIKKYLKICKFRSSKSLFDKRRVEDIKVCERVGCKYVHLRYIDAAWRKKSNLTLIDRFFGKSESIYPLEKDIFSERISNNDTNLIEKITLSLKAICKNADLIFAPLAIGKHIDHVLVRSIAIHLNKTLYLWEDYPYNLNNSDIFEFPGKFKVKRFKITPNKKKKAELIRIYNSQLPVIFTDRLIKFPKETFYFFAK